MDKTSPAFCISLIPRCTASTSRRATADSNGSPERRRRYKYWNIRNLERELRRFASLQDAPHRMPTQQELVKAGRQDMCGAIRRNGGWMKTASELHWKPCCIARPRSLYLTFCMEPASFTMKSFGYWNSFENLRIELNAYLDAKRSKCGGDDVFFPTAQELKLAGKTGLLRAIYKHGGSGVVASKLGVRTRNRRMKYWTQNNYEMLKAEILSMFSKSAKKEMPTRKALLELNNTEVLKVCTKLGGVKHVAMLLGLPYARKKNKAQNSSKER